MIWTAAYGHESCPACGHRFVRDEPMALLTSRRLKRCAPCVSPDPVDWDAVHAVTEQRRAQRTGEPVGNVREQFEHVTPGSLNEVLKNYGIKGVRRSKVRPYSEVAHLETNRTGGDK